MHLVKRRVLGRTAVAAAATLASALAPRNSAAEAALRQPGPLDPGPGKPLPELRFKAADGADRTLADYAGTPVVLNFWATWCVPCVAEMAALDALAAALGTKAAILPVSSDRGGAAAVTRFYAERRITHLPVLLDPLGAAVRATGARGIPTTLLIDTQGRERSRVEGAAAWSTPDTIALVRALAP